ncbi:MAG TPA: ATP-dependent 6-phosphofructokinase, partial [Gemmatales bacterium]|nr:ATP-dependent 6-phosphofructokinase [Gemmatales bacterium]
MNSQSPTNLPDFNIQRLGPAVIDSPLAGCFSDNAGFFIGDDDRTLYDTIGQAWSHGDMPTKIDAVNLEIAGPRRYLFFEPAHTKAAIVTCGGLCPGLNNVIRSLVLSLYQQYGVRNILGIRYGYAGMVESGKPPLQLTPEVVDNIHLQGGTFLGSSRGPQEIEAMLAFLKDRQIHLLFTIGGDGTQRGAMLLAQAALHAGYPLAVVGLPKTIDNDLNYVDRTFGFETAFSLADQALRAAYAEAKGVINGIGIVKLMGRHSGYITALSSLAHGQVNFVLVPEVPFDIHGEQGFLSALRRRLDQHGYALVAVAEGAGQDLLQEEVQRAGTDASGNQKLADIGAALRRAIESYGKAEAMHINVRYIDPSYMIRS